MQNGLISIVAKSKLGRCPKCISQSFVGFVACWFSFLMMSLFSINSMIYDFTLTLATAFTILIVAHFIAFLLREQSVLKQRKECCMEYALNDKYIIRFNENDESVAEEKSENDQQMSRREFFSYSLKMFAGIMAMSILGPLLANANTNADAQQGPHYCVYTVKQAVGNCGSINVGDVVCLDCILPANCPPKTGCIKGHCVLEIIGITPAGSCIPCASPLEGGKGHRLGKKWNCS